MDTYSPFIPFGLAHMSTMLIIGVVVLVIPMALKKVDDNRALVNARILAVLLIISESAKPLISVLIYHNQLNASLPLHLCGVAAFLAAWTLWRRSFRSYEIVYFWGIGGGIPAILSPDLLAGFPHPSFFYFFISHGLILLGVMYATIVFRFRPSFASVGKAIVATLVLMAVIYPVNLLLNSNYMYLLAKPQALTLMEFMGQWPWYILTLTFIGIVVYLLCYLPFVFIGRREQQQ
ncbi:MAG: TIGR02206 family membrane protein [Gammaproteobacteria bacterium]|nr:TIGR02206 family membrane protein [Gammaproteobacteria bacterium]